MIGNHLRMLRDTNRRLEETKKKIGKIKAEITIIEEK